MSIIGTYLPDAISDALGWTILHSLWQATGIGLIAMILLKIRNQGSPQFRYLVGMLSMLAIFASSVFTFILEYQAAGAMPVVSGVHGTDTGWESLLSISTSGSPHTLDEFFPWLTLIWISGVLILSFRLAGGIALVARLRNDQISPLPQIWNKRIRTLIRKSGISRRVKFVVSGKVVVPTVIGILKPMVLIPAGIISLMPFEQLEAVLAHEIAHIRRYDFLINIVQSLIEALFFYHPVVWILSRSVRQEREKCCDDYAVSISGKLTVYARALAGLSEIQVRTAVPSVALAGNRNRIFIRVERLLKQQKMKNNASEKILAGLLILGSAMILTFSTGASQGAHDSVLGTSQKFNLQIFEKAASTEAEPSVTAEQGLPAEPAVPAVPSVPAEPGLPAVPAVPAELSVSDSNIYSSRERMDVKDNIVSRTFITKDDKEMNMRFTIRNGEVKELYVDGKKIPESDYPGYQKEIDRTLDDLRDMEADLKKAREELEDIDLDEIRAQVQAGMEQFQKEDMVKLQEEMKELQEQQFDFQFDQEAMQKEMEKAMREVIMNKEVIQEEMRKAQEEVKKAIEEGRMDGHKLSDEEIRKMELAMAEAMQRVESLNHDEMMARMEAELQAIQEIDHERIRREIELSMREVDFVNLEQKMAEAMKKMEKEMINLDKERINLDKEMEHIDDLINELEKLELK